MGPSTAVITSLYGDYDTLVAPAAQSIDIDWVCVTDNSSRVPSPWRVVREPRPHMHPRMAAKLARCRPDLYTNAATTVWVDTSARLAADAIPALIADVDDIGMFVHPERSDIEAEAVYSAGMRKYRDLPMQEQCAHYRRQGLPPSGLWATGCIVRRMGPGVRRFGDVWLQEMWRWGWQDQLSAPYALWVCDLAPSRLPGDLWSNPLVEWTYQYRSSDALNFADQYAQRCDEASDIVDHLPFLHDTVCRFPAAQVVELGVRSGNSTAAFLAAVEAVDGHLWSVDINAPRTPEWWADTDRWSLHIGDDLTTEAGAFLPATIDVLFIDTSHAYDHTLAELETYVPRVSGCVLLHDTELREPEGIGPQPAFPVAAALDEFCARHGREWTNRAGCYGLGVMEII